MNGWARRFLLTAGMPHAHSVRGPSPVTVWVERASNNRVAPGNGLRPVRQPARRYGTVQTPREGFE